MSLCHAILPCRYRWLTVELPFNKRHAGVKHTLSTNSGEFTPLLGSMLIIELVTAPTLELMFYEPIEGWPAGSSVLAGPRRPAHLIDHRPRDEFDQLTINLDPWRDHLGWVQGLDSSAGQFDLQD